MNFLPNAAGNWVSDKEGMRSLIMEYFFDLFSPIRGNYEQVTKLAEPKISLVENQRLLAPLTIEEIQRLVFQMHLDKLPGLDDLFFFSRNFGIFLEIW